MELERPYFNYRPPLGTTEKNKIRRWRQCLLHGHTASSTEHIDLDEMCHAAQQPTPFVEVFSISLTTFVRW
jgi:hypothetical protein